MAVSIRQIIADVWAKTGARTDPGSTKTNLGFIEEIPPYQWFNHTMNQVFEALRTSEQLGIWPWHTSSEYEVDGVTIGSDGVPYQSKVAANAGNDPFTDGGTNWTSLLATAFAVADPGYIVLNMRPALIVQWGTVGLLADSATITVTLPTAYPTAHMIAIANTTEDGAPAGVVHAVPLSLTQIKLRNTDNEGDALTSAWLSIGY